MSGRILSEKELYAEYEKNWVNEGFLSREHEDMRKAAGKEALRKFFIRENALELKPAFIEKDFRWFSEDVKFTGRWDRIDLSQEGAVITDYKASEVRDQKEADKATTNSLQMDLYALSFSKVRKERLIEVRLHFLESDLIGHAEKKALDIERAWGKIYDAKEGILNHDFGAKPDWHNCSHCDFKTICPDSYAYWNEENVLGR